MGKIMKNRLIILLFATFLMADDNNLTLENSTTQLDNNTTKIEIPSNPNPKVYEALGNVVYDNVAYISKLQELPRYSKNIEKIQTYVSDVNETKEIGYGIENGSSSVTKGEYLTLIRALSKRNDDFKREIVSSYKSSMTYKDNEFFSQMINSGLIDTLKYKSEIMNYYLDNVTQVETAGVIKGFLDENEL